MELNGNVAGISAVWMPNHPRYQQRYANELAKMRSWATPKQIQELRAAARDLAWGNRWSLVLRSNYHKKIVTNINDPRYKIPDAELGRLVKTPLGFIGPESGADCNHYFQEELEHDPENPDRRRMRCAACGETFWITREKENEK